MSSISSAAVCEPCMAMRVWAIDARCNPKTSSDSTLQVFILEGERRRTRTDIQPSARETPHARLESRFAGRCCINPEAWPCQSTRQVVQYSSFCVICSVVLPTVLPIAKSVKVSGQDWRSQTVSQITPNRTFMPTMQQQQRHTPRCVRHSGTLAR